MLRRACLAVLVLALSAPGGAAWAGTVTKSGNRLIFTGTAGVDAVSVLQGPAAPAFV